MYFLWYFGKLFGRRTGANLSGVDQIMRWVGQAWVHGTQSIASRGVSVSRRWSHEERKHRQFTKDLNHYCHRGTMHRILVLTQTCRVRQSIRQILIPRSVRSFAFYNLHRSYCGRGLAEQVLSGEDLKWDAGVRSAFPRVSAGGRRRPTSIATIPKAKVSASRVYLSPLLRTSGAAHLAV